MRRSVVCYEDASSSINKSVLFIRSPVTGSVYVELNQLFLFGVVHKPLSRCCVPLNGMNIISPTVESILHIVRGLPRRLLSVSWAVKTANCCRPTGVVCFPEGGLSSVVSWLRISQRCYELSVYRLRTLRTTSLSEARCLSLCLQISAQPYSTITPLQMFAILDWISQQVLWSKPTLQILTTFKVIFFVDRGLFFLHAFSFLQVHVTLIAAAATRILRVIDTSSLPEARPEGFWS